MNNPDVTNRPSALNPLMTLQGMLLCESKANNNDPNKKRALLTPNAIRLIAYYMLMPGKLDHLLALVKFMRRDHYQFAFAAALDTIHQTVNDAIKQNNISLDFVDPIYDDAFAKLVRIIDDMGVNKQVLLSDAALKGNQLVVAQLLKVDGIDVNGKNEEGRTPLMQAAWSGHKTVVAQLLKVDGIDVNAEYRGDSSMKTTALQLAACSGETAVIAQLLKVNGIVVNDGNYIGGTALWWAAEFKQTEVMAQLCMKQLTDAAFADAAVKIELLTKTITNIPRTNHGPIISQEKMCDYLLTQVKALPTHAEQVALLEKALSRENAFSALMYQTPDNNVQSTSPAVIRIQQALNTLKVQSADVGSSSRSPVIFTGNASPKIATSGSTVSAKSSAF